MRRVIVAITGASGAIYGIRALQLLQGRARRRDPPHRDRLGQPDHRPRDRLPTRRRETTRRPRPPPARHRRGGVVGFVRHQRHAGRAVLGQDAERNRQLLQRRTRGAGRRRLPQGAQTGRSDAARDAVARGPHRPDGQGDRQRRDHHAPGSCLLRVARHQSTTSSIRPSPALSSCSTSRLPVSNGGMAIQSYPTSRSGPVDLAVAVVDAPPVQRTPLPVAGRLDTLVVAVFAIAVSAAGAARPSFWYDEAATVSAATRSLPDLFALLGNVDAVHGLYYLLMKAWFAVFPATEFWSRAPSALAVGIAAAGVVVLARQFTGRAAALCAGIAFAILPRTTWAGMEARSYAFQALVSVWLTVLFVAAVRSERPRTWCAVRRRPLRRRGTQHVPGAAGAGVRRVPLDADPITSQRGAVGHDDGRRTSCRDTADSVESQPDSPDQLGAASACAHLAGRLRRPVLRRQHSLRGGGRRGHCTRRGAAGASAQSVGSPHATARPRVCGVDGAAHRRAVGRHGVRQAHVHAEVPVLHDTGDGHRAGNLCAHDRPRPVAQWRCLHPADACGPPELPSGATWPVRQGRDGLQPGGRLDRYHRPTRRLPASRQHRAVADTADPGAHRGAASGIREARRPGTRRAAR